MSTLLERMEINEIPIVKKLNNFQETYDDYPKAAICYSMLEEQFGGEGSGCHGDNCGRPNGSGDEIDSIGKIFESGNISEADLEKLSEKNPKAELIISELINWKNGIYNPNYRLDEESKQIFDKLTTKKDYELYRIEPTSKIGDYNEGDNINFEDKPTYVSNNEEFVKNMGKLGKGKKPIIVFERGTNSLNLNKKDNRGEELIRGAYKVKKIEGDKVYVEQVKKQNMNLKFQNSYSDYPKAASENAKVALRWAEENGWGSCGTPVGKARANQLAKGEPISRDTIARMAAFERHRQNSQKELGDGCGRLMWLAWGGDEGIEWAQRKLEQIDREKKFSFSVVNNEERIVVGPAMIPDLPIYRRDETGEYYVFFDRKTIETIALKFYAKGFQQSANEMHMKPIEGVTFFQSWIADESKGIPKMKQFEDLPDGTWFLGAKVNNDETWEKVKDGTFRGFSVEGMFDMTEIKMRKSADEIIMKLRELLRDL